MLSYLPIIMLNIGIYQYRYIVYNTAAMKHFTLVCNINAVSLTRP